MSSAEKQQTMADFRSGKTQVLVSTTVVEVGVDVPNATVITVAGAERFGLAQLHQLRGRVGRGNRPGYCGVLLGETSSRPASGSTRSPRAPTASPWPSSTSNSAARATCSARSSTACRRC